MYFREILYDCIFRKSVDKIQVLLKYEINNGMEKLPYNWIYFREILYDCIFRKSVDKIQVLLKYEINNGYFARRPIYIFDHLSLISP